MCACVCACVCAFLCVVRACVQMCYGRVGLAQCGTVVEVLQGGGCLVHPLPITPIAVTVDPLLLRPVPATAPQEHFLHEPYGDSSILEHHFRLLDTVDF